MGAISNPLISAFKSAQPALNAPTPLVSNMVMPSAAPAMDAPVLPTVTRPPTQTETDTAHRNYLINSGDGISQIKNPLLRGIARTGDILGSVFAPGLAMAIPGTSLHHDIQVNKATQNLADDQGEDQAAATLEGTQALTDQRTSAAHKTDVATDDMTPFTMTRDQAEAINQPNLAGTQATMRDYAHLLASAGNNNTSTGNNTRTNETHVTTTSMNNATSTANNAANNAARETISTAANKTRLLVGDMQAATSRANNQNNNDHKAGSGVPGADGSFKVPADVTKRGALAANVNENADAVDALLKDHPDIVGSAGGRYTSVQQMIGSDDPAIAELGVRIHNIALASNGAHGVRAAGAIEQTENELFNHFKSGPTAIHAALQATRGSMQTFLDDEKNFSSTGKRTGGGEGGGKSGGGTQAFTDGGTTYHIPQSQIAEFKRDHPNAR